MNYQNIPRSDKVVKAAFVPKKDAFLLCDYDSIELRLLAFYMDSVGDPRMIQAIKAGDAGGDDLHTISARGALLLSGPITDEQRQVGKVLNYSIVYGGGAPTLMRQLGLTFQEAKNLLASFHDQWPGIRLVQNQIEARLTERGYITTLWGRHLHPDSPHKALNALVQGCAADLMKSALVKLDNATLNMESHMVSVIHDEVIFDCVEGELPWLAENVPVLMRDERVHSVMPIEVAVEVSRTTWAEKEPYGS